MSNNGWLGSLLHEQKMKYKQVLTLATPAMLRDVLNRLTEEMDAPDTTDERIDEIAQVQRRLRAELHKRGLKP